jgi:hypothetical protein
MMSRLGHTFLLTLLILVLSVPLVLAHPPATLLRDPCALDPANLVYNGSMGPEHGTPYGLVADGWEPFIFAQPPPRFRWVGNEQIDPNGSQQIYSSGTFDAGIQQTVRNLQPGVYYWFRLGYSLAAKSYSGPNVRVDSIGRKVGVDPFGGTDPKSPNVIWGPDLFDGNAALNRPQMEMIFAARADKATIFLRAMARDGSSGENRVWFDAVCMEARRDLGIATPAAATATPVPPTATRRPTQAKPTPKPRASPTRTRVVSPTPKVVAMRVDTPEPAETAAPVPSEGVAPKLVQSPTASPTARYARPEATPPSSPIQLNADMLTGVGMGSIIGSLVFFGLGLVLSRRTD